MRIKILTTFILATAFSATVLGQNQGGHPMQIELDVFSGRPNPTWTLTAVEAAELKAISASLPVLSTPQQSVSGLGYRGMTARSSVESGWSLYVFRDAVTIRTHEGSEFRSDPELSVERWLLRSAGDVVDPALMARLGY